jgi:5-methylcytosine-specific restriction enzyme subunit McrC
MMLLIRLTEYQRSSEPVALDTRQRSQLAELAHSIVLTPSETDGAFYLTPSSYVGVVTLDDLVIEVHPKIDVDNLFFLLSYALDPGGWREGDPSLTQRRPDIEFSELLIWMLAEHSSRAVRRGLLSGYIEREDTLRTIRGRIRIGDQITRRYRAYPPIECSFDEFTYDIPQNRFLKAAVKVALASRQRHVRLSQALQQLRAIFETVSNERYDPRQLPQFSFTRLNSHYRRALGIARIILAASELDLGTGPGRANAFLFNMNRVFQDFVTIALREACGVSSRVLRAEQRIFLDADRWLRLEPDISWWEDRACLFVGDIKYKRESVEGIPNADIYQTLAYAIAADLPEATLVYAKGEASPHDYTIDHAGKRVRVVALDLSAGPRQILAQVSQIGWYVENCANSSRNRFGPEFDLAI